jgi:Flp pilus assembly pilin Flp
MQTPIFRKLRDDECGAVSYGAYLLLATIVALGGLVGLTTFRDSVTQEFGDIAAAVNSLDQSFDVTVTVGVDVVYSAAYVDIEPDAPGENTDTPNAPPSCIVIGP